MQSLTDGQRRHLEACLSGLKAEAEDMMKWLAAQDLSPDSVVAVLARLHEIKSSAAQLAARLGINAEGFEPSPARRLQAWAASWESVMLDCRPVALRAYGEVDEETADLLGRPVERLSQMLRTLGQAAHRNLSDRAAGDG